MLPSSLRHPGGRLRPKDPYDFYVSSPLGSFATLARMTRRRETFSFAGEG
jgi:hypothetical protein